MVSILALLYISPGLLCRLDRTGTAAFACNAPLTARRWRCPPVIRRFFSNDSRILATWGANPNRFQLWQVSGWVLLRTMTTPKNADGVTALRFTPNNGYIVSTGYEPFVDEEGLWQQEGVIRWWNVSTGSLALTFDRETDIGVTSNVSWSPNAKNFVYGRYDGAAVAALSPF